MHEIAQHPGYCSTERRNGVYTRGDRRGNGCSDIVANQAIVGATVVPTGCGNRRHNDRPVYTVLHTT